MHCFWYIVKYDNQRSCWVSYKLPSEDYNLDIPDSEVTNRSEWGPIDDGKDSSDEEQDDNKSEAQPESIDIKIPTCYVTVGTFTRRGLSRLSRH